MADITRRRTGELLKVVFDVLTDKPEGMPAKDILEFIPDTIELNEYEKGYYPSTPDTQRYQKVVRFGTITLVKAGWMLKSKGRWYLTDAGQSAHIKYKDPERFYREAVKLYQEWKRNRPTETAKEEPEDVEEGAEKVSFTFEQAEENSWEQIQTYLQAMNPYEFQELCADLLRAMGYHVSWVAPPGKDYGVDIIAFTDPLGASNPRIKVQVKRRDTSTSVEGLRAFLSVLGSDDVGLFISSGGFTRDALDEARTQERRKVTLLDLQGLFDLWVEHYDKLSQDARRRFPLKPIYFLAPGE